MTHKELVKAAKQWLLKDQKCSVVLTEKASNHEVADAIGWKSARHSVLIECKTSRADFRADSKKWFRAEGLGMGQRRFFLAPKGIVPRDELPPGWGLLEVDGTKINVVVPCDLLCFDEKRCWAEMPLLVAAVRKLQYQNRNLRKELRKKKK